MLKLYFPLSLIFLLLFCATNNHPAYAANDYAKQIPILTYHRLLTDQENKSFRHENDVLSVRSFKEQMQVLYDNHFHTVTLNELKLFLDGKIKLPKKSVMIQFDDGRLDVYHYAYPIMKQFDLHGVANLITGRMHQHWAPKWNPDKNEFMSWDQVHAMQDIFEIAGHTNSLHNMQPDGRDNLVHTKISNREKLADLQLNHQLVGDSSGFAYPFGQYNPTVIQLVKEAGFQMAFTTKMGYVKPGDNMYLLPRIGITPWLSLNHFKSLIGVNSTDVSYYDVSKTSSIYDILKWAKDNNIATGYPNGYFYPKQTLTRAEAAKMLVQALNIQLPALKDINKPPFVDIPLNDKDHYLVRALTGLKRSKVFHGDTNGQFKPQDPITHQQMASVLVNAYGLRHYTKDTNIKELNKIYPSHINDVEILAGNAITPLPSHAFKPNQPTERIELVTFIHNIYKLFSL